MAQKLKTKTNDDERHMLNVMLPPGAHAQFKMLATQQGKNMASIVRDLVLGYNRRHWRTLVTVANTAQRANTAKENQ